MNYQNYFRKNNRAKVKKRKQNKYLLHFKEDVISPIKLSEHNNREAFDYIQMNFKGIFEMKIGEISNLVVFSPLENHELTKDKLIMTLVNNNLHLQPNDVLLIANPEILAKITVDGSIQSLPLGGLSKTDMEDVLDDVVLPANRIKQVTQFVETFQLNLTNKGQE